MRHATPTLALAGILFSPLLSMAAPPGRPLGLTAAQFQTLRQIKAQPQHQAVLHVHATYDSEREQRMENTRNIDDITTGATFAGYAAAIITILIVAAPL